MISTAFADEVSIKGLSSSGNQFAGEVTIKDKDGNKVGKTHKTSGFPPKVKVDLDPGVYTFEFEGENTDTRRIESGTKQFTVVAGGTNSTIINTDSSPGGKPNDPESGTAANGITPTGQADASSQTYISPRIGGFQVSLKAGANYQIGDGIIALPQFTGGNPDGVNGLDADVDHVGSSISGKIGYGIDMPETGPGADRIFFGFRGQSNWGESSTKKSQIMAPGISIYEISGLNVLPNIATNQVDDVEARTEIDELEFNIRMGLIYQFGAAGSSIGNLLFGNLGPADRKRFRLAILGDLFYRYGERNDALSFNNGGVSNRYDSTIDTHVFGGRLSAVAKVPLGRGLTLSGGPFVGVYNSDDDLAASYLRGAAVDSFNTSESKVGYEVGFTAGLSAKLGPGKLSGFANFMYKSDAAILHLRESNSDTTGIDYTDFKQLTVGTKYRVPLDVFSDIRLKIDIVHLGALPSGLPVYSFKYVWSPVTHVGVMAQEAMVVFPDAVHEVDGFLTVDYSRIR